MHCCGDTDFNWDRLYQAINMLASQMRLHHMPVVQIKEKFGEVRCYMSPAWDSLHALVWPGHVYCRWPCTCGVGVRYHNDKHSRWCVRSWLWKLDIYVWPRVFRWTGLQCVLNAYYRRAYVMAYTRTTRAYPDLSEELIDPADHYRWLSHMRQSSWQSVDDEGNWVPVKQPPQNDGWRVLLAAKAFDRMMEIGENPPPPSDKLKQAMTNYSLQGIDK